MKEKSKFVKVILIIFIIAGLALTVAGLTNMMNYKSKIKQYAKTTGELTGYNKTFEGKKKPVYTYVINSSLYEVEAGYTLDANSDSSTKTAVIYYDQNNYLSSEVASIDNDWFFILSGIAIFAIAVGALIKTNNNPESLEEQVNISKGVLSIWTCAIVAFAVGLQLFVCSSYNSIFVIFGTTLGIMWSVVLSLIIITAIIFMILNLFKSKNKAFNLYN